MANRVMRTREPAAAVRSTAATSVQRVCTECDKQKGDEESLPQQVETAIHAIEGTGQPLPEPLRMFMERRFSAEFSDVRIHTDVRAHHLARALDAQAFTIGRDVVFGAGHYAPDSERGRRLLAHELTHVVQQGAALSEADARVQRQPESAAMDSEPATTPPPAETGIGEALSGLFPPVDVMSLLPSLTPCRPAGSRLEAEALWTFVTGSFIPFARGMFGSETTSLWLDYLNRSSTAMPRPARSFAGSSSSIVTGFTTHHKSAEAELEVVAAAGAALSGPSASRRPAPGTSVVVPVTSLVPAATLRTRINSGADPMGLTYDAPATTIPGNIAGGIGSGGPPGQPASDPDTRAVDGTLQLTLDAAGTLLTIAPNLTFGVHDTVDFCPGALGGLAARVETVPMSVLEATEGLFGPVFAADVPFDVDYPGPGVARTIAVTPAPPTPTPTPTPTPPGPPPTPGPTSRCPISTERGRTAGLKFEFTISSATLTPRQRLDIQTFARGWMTTPTGGTVRVDGFASVDGSAANNMTLSCDRAQAVRDELIRDGIPSASVAIFAHGETREFSPTSLQDNRAAVIATTPSPTPPLPTPPVPPTPTPILRLRSIRFLSDHGLMKDNVGSWDDTGTVRKPEWESTTPDGTSAPISHTKGEHIRIRVAFDMSPESLPVTAVTLTGTSLHPFLSFTGSGSASGGDNQEMELVSRGALPNQIDDRFQGLTINWAANVSGRSQALGSSVDHGVYVTYDVPSGGVTQQRVATAAQLTKGFGNDPHAIVSGEMKRFPSYNLKRGYRGNIWPLADDIPSSAECQAIVRFVQAVNRMVGIPGEATGIAVYASPDAPDAPIVAMLVESGGATGAMADFPPQPGTGYKAFLFDAGDQGNNYEAALQFKHGVERYYPGGVPGGVGLASTLQVLHSFKKMAWARFDVASGEWEPVVTIHCYWPPC